MWKEKNSAGTWVSQVVLVVKNVPTNAGDTEMRVQTLGREDLLEEGILPLPSFAFNLSQHQGLSQ